MNKNSGSEKKNNSNNNSYRHCHSSYNLGNPPGSERKPNKAQQNKVDIMPPNNPVQKIAPMKELEKMMTDLKKENFDLKLRLYHSENTLNRDYTTVQLIEENNRLRVSLKEALKELKREKKERRSIGTQTDSTKEATFGLPVIKRPSLKKDTTFKIEKLQNLTIQSNEVYISYQ